MSKAREEGALTVRESNEIFLKSQLSKNCNNNAGSAMEQMMLRNEEAALFDANGSRGLNRMNAHQIQSMYSNLVPEGTREYSDKLGHGCPGGPGGRSRRGTVR